MPVMRMGMITNYEYLPGSKLELTVMPCPGCNQPHKIVVGEYQFENWCDGVLHIQEAFPDNTPAEQELLLTAICDECFQKMREQEEF